VTATIELGQSSDDDDDEDEDEKEEFNEVFNTNNGNGNTHMRGSESGGVVRHNYQRMHFHTLIG